MEVAGTEQEPEDDGGKETREDGAEVFHGCVGDEVMRQSFGLALASFLSFECWRRWSARVSKLEPRRLRPTVSSRVIWDSCQVVST